MMQKVGTGTKEKNLFLGSERRRPGTWVTYLLLWTSFVPTAVLGPWVVSGQIEPKPIAAEELRTREKRPLSWGLGVS